jgi:hypothetical protein
VPALPETPPVVPGTLPVPAPTSSSVISGPHASGSSDINQTETPNEARLATTTRLPEIEEEISSPISLRDLA